MIKVTNKISATLPLVVKLDNGKSKTFFIPPRVRGLIIEEVTLGQVIDSAMPLKISGVRDRSKPRRESMRSPNAVTLEKKE